MRFAAIADVHGNRLALDAVLADIAAIGISEVVNVGDHLSGPLEPARTADLLIELGLPSVLGDQDRRLIELYRAGTSTRSDFRELERKHFDWMASLPPTLVYQDEVYLCHAAPTDDGAFWLDCVAADGTVRPSTTEAIEAQARGIDASLILCGHTHIARCHCVDHCLAEGPPGGGAVPECVAVNMLCSQCPSPSEPCGPMTHDSHSVSSPC